MLNIAKYENFSANKYENANYWKWSEVPRWHFKDTHFLISTLKGNATQVNYMFQNVESYKICILIQVWSKYVKH